MSAADDPDAEAASTPLAPWKRYAPLAGVLAVALAALRWMLQGTHNVYTDVARTFWVQDADIGWVQTERGWIWLGLEVIGLLAGLVLGLLVLRWTRRHLGGRLARVAHHLIGLGSAVQWLLPALPIAALLSGLPPAGSAALLPTAALAAAGSGQATTLDPNAVPAGRYGVAASAVNLLNVRIAAGEDTFDARFGPITGSLSLRPDALSEARGSFSVPAASIDTGIALRSEHARDDLRVAEYPTIRGDVTAVGDLRPHGQGGAAFSASITLHLLGKEMTVPGEGSVEPLRDRQRVKLGLSGAGLIATVAFAIPVAHTGLDAASFDEDSFHVTARLALTLGASAEPPTP